MPENPKPSFDFFSLRINLSGYQMLKETPLTASSQSHLFSYSGQRDGPGCQMRLNFQHMIVGINADIAEVIKSILNLSSTSLEKNRVNTNAINLLFITLTPVR